MPKPLRMLLVGINHPHGPLWRESLRHHPAFEMAGAVDADPERAAGLLAREQTELPVHEDLGSAIERLSPDAALVTLPNDMTPDAIGKLARAGLPMIVEKPGALSAAAFAPALDAVQEAGVPLLPAYLRRFSPVAAGMRDLVAEGAIGGLASAEVTHATAGVALRNAAYLAGLTMEEVRDRGTPVEQAPGAGAVHWLFDRARSGGGIMHWLGVHWLDLLLMVTGEEADTISATLATRTGVPIDVEDIASLSLTLGSGAIATVTCAYTLPSGPDRARIVLYGSHGWMAWDGASPELTVISDPSSRSTETRRTLRFPVEERPGYAGALGWAALDAFHAAVREGRPLPVGAEDAMRTLAILDGIHRSNREGRRVGIGG